MPKLAWYVATLLVECQVSHGGAPTRLCDEQIHVIRAYDAPHAYAKAVAVGKAAEVTYENDYGAMVSWQFVGLLELSALDAAVIRDGTEIRSRLFHHRNPQDLIELPDRLDVFLSDPIPNPLPPPVADQERQ